MIAEVRVYDQFLSTTQRRQIEEELSDRYHGRASGACLDDSDIPTIRTSSVGIPPFIITVARSASDGFTPSQVVDDLQDKLLRNLHSLYCGCSSTSVYSRPPLSKTSKTEFRNAETCLSGCRFQVIFDYGPWEGATFS